MALIIAAVVGVSVYVGWNLSHAERRPIDRTPDELGMVYEQVEFPSLDGVTLRGWFMPAGGSTGHEDKTIVFVHGFRTTRLQPSVPALELAHSFVEDGFNVLMFDLRNSGLSDGDTTTLGYHEVKDVHAAVRWLKEERAEQAEHIGAIGFSMGAVTTLMAAVNEPEIEAVIADSPFSDLRSYLKTNMPFWTGLPSFPFTWTIMALLPPLIDLQTDAVSPVRVMSDIRQPVLLIHASDDPAIPSGESERLAMAGDPQRVDLWIVPSDRHVGARRTDPAVYDTRVIDFFRQHL